MNMKYPSKKLESLLLTLGSRAWAYDRERRGEGAKRIKPTVSRIRNLVRLNELEKALGCVCRARGRWENELSWVMEKEFAKLEAELRREVASGVPPGEEKTPQKA